jgi:hypothetical protein
MPARARALPLLVTLLSCAPATRQSTQDAQCRDAHFVGNTTAVDVLFDFLSHNRTIVAADDREAKPDRADFELIFACGNWYDDRKAAMVHHLANAHLSAKILIAGGQAERLTTLRAEAAGGEPFEMLDVLQRRFNISNRRVIVWTGSRVTTHNLRILLHYVKQVYEFERRASVVTVVEEPYLVARVAATLSFLLRDDATANRALRSLEVHTIVYSALYSVL